MKRAGGWILGFLVIASMTAATWFVVGPALNRKTIAVIFLQSGRGDTPTSRALLRGATRALDEAGSRAGKFKVILINHASPSPDAPDPIDVWFGTSEAILDLGDQQRWPLLISAFETHPRELSRAFQITPTFERQGQAAAAWAVRKGATRVFVIYEDQNPRSAAIGMAFWTAAKASGLEAQGCALGTPPNSSISRVDDIVAIKPDLIFFAGESAPYGRTFELFSMLRKEGFNGPLIAGEADPEVSFLATRPDLAEGTYLVSPFAPAPPELATRMGFVPGPHVTAGYYAMKAALEAIDHANSMEPEDLRRAAAKLPYFDAQGKAALRKCALYVARNGRFEFVELLE